MLYPPFAGSRDYENIAKDQQALDRLHAAQILVNVIKYQQRVHNTGTVMMSEQPGLAC
jgi:hypothetical protein